MQRRCLRLNRDRLCRKVQNKPRQPGAHNIGDPGVTTGVGHTGQGQDVFLALILDDAHNVIDGDLAHQPTAGVEHNRAPGGVIFAQNERWIVKHRQANRRIHARSVAASTPTDFFVALHRIET